MYKAGDQVVTKQGTEGYIVEEVQGRESMYYIRMTSGYTLVTESDISLNDRYRNVSKNTPRE